jgi:pyridoxal biosynthesis lyase PdxS
VRDLESQLANAQARLRWETMRGTDEPDDIHEAIKHLRLVRRLERQALQDENAALKANLANLREEVEERFRLPLMMFIAGSPTHNVLDEVRRQVLEVVDAAACPESQKEKE